MSTAIQMNATAPRVRSFYTRVTALGFGLITLSGIVAAITSIATGETGDGFVFSLVFIVVGLLVAGAVWSFGRWALVLAALLSLALLALVGPFALFALAHPESAIEFVPVLLMLVGALLGLVGAIVALVQSRRRTIRTDPTGTERLVLGTLLGAVALASLLSMVLTLTSRTTVSAQARVGATSVQLKHFAFGPQTMQAKAGDTVRLVIKNDDPNLHTFTLPAAGVDVAVPPGSEKIVEFKAPAAGTYQYYCIPHAFESGGTYDGMVGTLMVQ